MQCVSSLQRNLEADPPERKPSRPCGADGAPVFPWTRSMTSDVVVRTRCSPRTAMCAVGAALLLQSGWACRRAATATAPRPPEVSVLTVAPETVSARYEFVGQAVASRHVEVRAQVAGVIVARPYAEGTDVPKGALLFQIDSTTYDAAYRSALAQLADATARSANAERNWSRLKTLLGALAVQVTLADGSMFPGTGQLNFVDLALQPATGTLSLRAEFRNPRHVLLPGQFVRLHFVGLKRPDAILVPQRAVQRGLAGAFVYVLADSNRVTVRDVVATSWDRGGWLIDQGLRAGDRVVVDGIQKVAPGQLATPVAYKPAVDSSAAALGDSAVIAAPSAPPKIKVGP